jgi:hypothetical protein
MTEQEKDISRNVASGDNILMQVILALVKGMDLI